MNLFAPMYVVAMVCMTGWPDVCREIVADELITNPAQCFSKAIVLGAEWVDRHPGWEFLTARCSTDPPEPKGTDL